MQAQARRPPPEIIDVEVSPRPGRWLGLGLLGGPQPVTVRRFSDAALQAQIDRLLAALPKDVKAAELEIGADPEGVQVAVAVNLKHGWTIRGGVSYDYGASWGGKVGIRWTGR